MPGRNETIPKALLILNIKIGVLLRKVPRGQTFWKIV